MIHIQQQLPIDVLLFALSVSLKAESFEVGARLGKNDEMSGTFGVVEENDHVALDFGAVKALPDMICRMYLLCRCHDGRKNAVLFFASHSFYNPLKWGEIYCDKLFRGYTW
jgi:hypothetical protein